MVMKKNKYSLNLKITAFTVAVIFFFTQTGWAGDYSTLRPRSTAGNPVEGKEISGAMHEGRANIEARSGRLRFEHSRPGEDQEEKIRFLEDAGLARIIERYRDFFELKGEDNIQKRAATLFDNLSGMIDTKESIFTQVKEVDDVVSRLAVQNWAYREVKNRTTTAKNKSSTGLKAAFRHITLFEDDRTVQERIKRAIGSLRYYIANNRQEIFKQPRAKVSRIYFGSRTGFFDINHVKDYKGHVIEVVVVLNGRSELGSFEIDKNTIKEQFPELEDISKMEVKTIGIENLKEAMRGVILPPALEEIVKKKKLVNSAEGLRAFIRNNPKLSPRAVEELQRLINEHRAKANLRRLVVKMYREYAQLVGPNIIDESNREAFNQAISVYELAYLDELVALLNEHSARIPALKKTRDDVSAEVKSKETRLEEMLKTHEGALKACDDEIKQIEGTLAGLEEQKKALQAKLGEVAALNDEYEELNRRHYELTESPDAQAINEHNARVREFKANKMQKLVELRKVSKEIERDLYVLDRRIAGINQYELEPKKREREQKFAQISKVRQEEKVIEELKDKLAQFELSLYEAEVREELLTKRIEDAQVGYPLTAGVTIHNRYKVINKLGGGGFGAVYRVRDTQTGLEMAVKILDTSKQRHAKKDLAIKLFEHGKRVHKELEEVHKAPVPSYKGEGDYANSPFYVMSYERGLTLREIINGLKQGTLKLSLKERVTIALAAARALAYIHSCGAIHKDIKPEQIMIPAQKDEKGNYVLVVPDIEKEHADYLKFLNKACILDFETTQMGKKAIPAKDKEGEDKDTNKKGKNKEGKDKEGEAIEDMESGWDYAEDKELNTQLTQSNILLGTPAYQPPEQVERKSTSRTDVYALGMTFYELLTHHHPADFSKMGKKNIFFFHANEIPILVRDIIKQENKKLVQARLQDPWADDQLLEEIQEGLTTKLLEKGILQADEEQRIFEWNKEAIANEDVFIENLAKIEGLTDDDINVIVALTFNQLPSVDGELEALVAKMVEKKQGDRPTSKTVEYELEKWLLGKQEEMVYRPVGEAKQKAGWGVRMGRWGETHWIRAMFYTAMIMGTVILGVGEYARRKIGEADSIAVRARADKVEAERLMKKAREGLDDREKLVAEAAKQLAAINKTIESSTQKKGELEKQQKTILESIEELKSKLAEADRSVKEAEEKKKDAEQQLKTSNAQLEKAKEDFKKQQDELTAKITKIKNELEEAQNRLKVITESVAGIFEEAKNSAKNFESAIAVLNRLPWGGLDDEQNLAKISLGFDEILKILLDNGQFAEAKNVEERRRQRLEWSFTKMKSEASKKIFESHINTLRILRAEGKYDEVLRYADNMAQTTESAEWKDILRNTSIELLVESAYYEKDAAKKEAKLAQAKGLIEQIKNENDRTFYLADLNFAKGAYKDAMDLYTQDHDRWAGSAGEKDIAQDIKKIRLERASYSALTNAMVQLKMAVDFKAANDADNAKKAVADGLQVLEDWSKKYQGQKEHEAWALFVKGELYRINGEKDKSDSAYKESDRLAADNNLNALRALAKNKAGGAVNLDSMANAWSAIAAGKVPLSLRGNARDILPGATAAYKDKIEKEKQKAIEEQKKKKASMIEPEKLQVKKMQVAKEIQTLNRNLAFRNDNLTRKQLAMAQKEMRSIETAEKSNNYPAVGWLLTAGFTSLVVSSQKSAQKYMIVDAQDLPGIDTKLLHNQMIGEARYVVIDSSKTKNRALDIVENLQSDYPNLTVENALFLVKEGSRIDLTGAKAQRFRQEVLAEIIKGLIQIIHNPTPEIEKIFEQLKNDERAIELLKETA